jgi:hypothetical protein
MATRKFFKERRFLGLTLRSWIFTGLVLSLCGYIYAIRVPPTPNGFEQPDAQHPNRLRSPWGVEKPI